jgi:acyl carrier protein
VLGVERVGINDSFIDLGGHSLLALRIIGRLRDDLRIEIPLIKFFETPTVAGLAQIAAQIQAEQEESERREVLEALASLSEEEAGRELEKRMNNL